MDRGRSAGNLVCSGARAVRPRNPSHRKGARVRGLFVHACSSLKPAEHTLIHHSDEPDALPGVVVVVVVVDQPISIVENTVNTVLIF